MERRPNPVCKGFLLCRQIFVDPVRQDYTLVAPVHQVFAPRYPLLEYLSVFARWSSARGVAMRRMSPPRSSFSRALIR